MKKIAIQGIQGSFHESAARLFFPNEEVDIIACSTFKDVFKTVKKSPETIAVVAIENTIAGSLLPNYDLIRKSGLSIVGEHKLRIKHCVCAVPGQKLKELKEVYSHPIALMQCGDFLDKNSQLKVIEYEDTASSARMIAEKKLMGAAAICSTFAAQMYGLEVLQEGIETNKHNFTRFLVLASPAQADELRKGKLATKSSIVFSVTHAAGALSKVLSIFTFYDINLTKIQSLPIVGREWEYQFYVDLQYDNYERYLQSLEAIRPLTKDLVNLGDYAEGEQTV
jgi:prephenate dehydratase